MKQIKFYGFGCLLIVLLMIGYFFPTQERGLVKKNEEAVKIGVLQLLSHQALDSIYEGFVEEMETQGYSVGENLLIDFQNAQGDQSNLALMSEKLVTEDNQVIVGITTPASQSLANATKEKNIIMSGVTYPVESGLVDSEERPGRNVTGVSDRTPMKQQLEVMKSMLPHMKKIGILYTASEDNSARQAREAKKIAESLGLEVELATVVNTNDIQQVTENLAGSVEAIFVPVDNTIASAMPTVVSVADQFRIGVFPSADTMVKDGGVLAIGVDQKRIGIETAKLTVKILKGEKPADTAIVLANQGVIYLNDQKAAELGIRVPESIQATAVHVVSEE